MATEVLTIKQVAEMLHLHVMTVYRLAKEGKIPGFRVGGRWRFNREAMQVWMVDQAQVARLEGEARRLKHGKQ